MANRERDANGRFLPGHTKVGGSKRGPAVRLHGYRGLLGVLNELAAEWADSGEFEAHLRQYADKYGILAAYDQYIAPIVIRIAEREVQIEPLPPQRIILGWGPDQDATPLGCDDLPGG